MSGYKPPRWLEGIVERVLPPDLAGQGTLGDLAEEFERRALRSPRWAMVWYAGQTVSIVGSRAFTRGGADRAFSGSALWMDVRWSVRSVLKNPVFAVSIAAVLGLGLGANAAVYSVVDGTFRNTSWWRNSDATVSVWPGKPFSRGMLGLYQNRQSVYQALGGYSEAAFAVQMPDGTSESVNGVMITPELFRELSAQPTLGRALADDDGIPFVEPVVVMSDALWRRAFGADPAIVGTRVRVNGLPTTVIGIQSVGGKAPGGRSELWVPHPLDPRHDDFWKAQFMDLVGVLRPGVSMREAYDDLLAYNEYLTRIFPNNFRPGYGLGEATVARADEAERRLISTPLLLLLGGTALLLFVTALNVGNLLLGRAINRRTELAVRTALGAGRARITQQLLVEGVVLTVLAVCVGLAMGVVVGPQIARLFVGESVVVSSSITSPAVLLFLGVMSVVAWLVLCGVPIVHYLRSERTGLTVKPSSGTRAQRSLVTVQAAFATLLLVAATLLIQTVDNLRNVPLGFDTDRLLTVELSVPMDVEPEAAEERVLYDRLVDRVRAIPGVRSVGVTSFLPLRSLAPNAPINLEKSPGLHYEAPRARKHWVDPGFFEAMQITPTEGRVIGTQERTDEPSAVVVNQSLAEMLWPGESPIGQRMAVDAHAWDTWLPVVGVIPDIRSDEITGPIGPAMYVSVMEKPAPQITLVVRASALDPTLGQAIRDVVTSVDPTIAIRTVKPMDDIVREAYSTSWVMMGLLIVLAVLATGLGAVGIYAVLAHHVALTKREIGIRMALGAQRGNVVGGIVRSGVMLAGVGILLGSVGAVISTRYLESLLFGVSALAPWAFVAPALGLLVAAALAALIPAARAGSLAPADVLRGE